MSVKGLVIPILVCYWFVCTLCPAAAAYGPLNHACCVKYTQKPLTFSLIKGYMMQSSLEVCRIDAIIFITKRNRKVCASVADEWVRKTLSRLSEKMKKMSKLNANRAATVSVSTVWAQNTTTVS